MPRSYLFFNARKRQKYIKLRWFAQQMGCFCKIAE